MHYYTNYLTPKHKYATHNMWQDCVNISIAIFGKRISARTFKFPSFKYKIPAEIKPKTATTKNGVWHKILVSVPCYAVTKSELYTKYIQEW